MEVEVPHICKQLGDFILHQQSLQLAELSLQELNVDVYHNTSLVKNNLQQLRLTSHKALKATKDMLNITVEAERMHNKDLVLFSKIFTKNILKKKDSIKRYVKDIKESLENILSEEILEDYLKKLGEKLTSFQEKIKNLKQLKTDYQDPANIRRANNELRAIQYQQKTFLQKIIYIFGYFFQKNKTAQELDFELTQLEKKVQKEWKEFGNVDLYLREKLPKPHLDLKKFLTALEIFEEDYLNLESHAFVMIMLDSDNLYDENSEFFSNEEYAKQLHEYAVSFSNKIKMIKSFMQMFSETFENEYQAICLQKHTQEWNHYKTQMTQLQLKYLEVEQTTGLPGDGVQGDEGAAPKENEEPSRISKECSSIVLKRSALLEKISSYFNN